MNNIHFIYNTGLTLEVRDKIFAPKANIFKVALNAQSSNTLRSGSF